MRRIAVKLTACLLALACLPAAARAAQSAGSYSLDDIMASPSEYLEREVMFYARFAATADLFKTVDTGFAAADHVNFAVWPDKSLLWTKNGRKNILPTLYVEKGGREAAALERLGKYDLAAFTGSVRRAYAGHPWILVTKIEKIHNAAERLEARTAEHMQAGSDSLGAGAAAAAARHFEQALDFGLPPEYRGAAYSQLAQAYLLTEDLDRARDSLRQAAAADEKNPRLHLALADVCLRMDDADEALAHATIALELSGKYPQAYGIRGEALSLLGDNAAAFTELAAASGTPGTGSREKAVISLRRARIYARSGRPADAERLYAEISRPGEPLAAEADVRNEIGLFHERRYAESGEARSLDSAAAAFGEAAAIAPANPVFLYNRAETEFRRQKLSASPDMTLVRAALDALARVDPDYPAGRLLLGRVLFREGKTAEAERIYRSVAPGVGTDSMALLALSEAYLELGRFDDALAAVRCAREARPWNSRVRALGERIESAAAAGAQVASAPAAPQAKNVPESVPGKYSPNKPDKNGFIPLVPKAKTEATLPEFASAHPLRPPEPRSIKRAGQRERRPRSDGFVALVPDKAPDTTADNSDSRTEPPGGGTADGAGVPDIASLTNPRDADLVDLVNTPAMRPPSGAPAGRFPMTRVELPKSLRPAEEGGTADFIRLDDIAPAAAPAVPEAPASRPIEATTDADGFIRFGMLPRAAPGIAPGIVNVGAAYASLPVPDAVSPAPVAGNDGVRIPPVFTFKPDTSPVLIANFRPLPAGNDRRSVRNANLYKRRNANRPRPAEIIDRAPVSPYPGDTSAMIAPDMPTPPRTAVRLPSSSGGIGGNPEGAR